jgi:integrase/recombinase XerD
MLLVEVIPSFLSHCGSERRLSPLTVEAYGADLRDFGAHIGAGKVLEEITIDDLKGYLSHLNDHRTLTVATVRRRFATLQGLFKWAAADERFENPFIRWRPKLKKPKRLPRALQRAELSALLNAAQSRSRRSSASKMTFLALTLMAATGLRVSELCALTIEDMSPDGSTLRIRGKGSRDRVVFVSNEWLQGLLSAWRQTRACLVSGNAAVFVGRHGGQLNPAALRGRTKRLASAGNTARKVTPHMLRHTAATLLIEEGVDIRIVQRLLGHASIATTEIYTHVADEALRRSLAQADVIGRVVAKGQG